MKKNINPAAPYNPLWEQDTKLIQIIPAVDWFAVGPDGDGVLMSEPLTAFGLTEHGDVIPLSVARDAICAVAPDGFKGEIIHKLQMTESQLKAIDIFKHEID